MTEASPLPGDVTQEINRILSENFSAAAGLGTDDQVKKALQNITGLDEAFQQRGGLYFRTGSTALETAERFTEIHVEQYREKGRPSLPALAIHHAELLGIAKDSPEYKALILVAVRAEMEASVTPDYHSKHHYMDVAAMTANLLEKNDEMVKQGKGIALTVEEKALAFISAIGHDLDHAGKGNPPDDPLFNETKSFRIMEPLLREAGLGERQIEQAYVILMTTSPNGPHAILKEIAKAQRAGVQTTVAEIQDRERAAREKAGHRMLNRDFRKELDPLTTEAALAQMAAIVSDADLYSSGGAGMAANAVMSRLLTEEGRKYNDSKADLTSDAARKYFLDAVVGAEGFASWAGREAANDVFESMRVETEQRIAAAKAGRRPAPRDPSGPGKPPP